MARLRFEASDLSLGNCLFHEHLDFHCLSSFHCIHRPRLSSSGGADEHWDILRCWRTRFAFWVCKQERTASYLCVACNSSWLCLIPSVTASPWHGTENTPVLHCHLSCWHSLIPVCAGSPFWAPGLDGLFQFFSEIAGFCNIDHYQLKDEISVLILTAMLTKKVPPEPALNQHYSPPAILETRLWAVKQTMEIKLILSINHQLCWHCTHLT